jgi:hypothetical protein
MWRPDRARREPTPANLAELEALERVLSATRAGDPDPEHVGLAAEHDSLAQLVADVRDAHPPLRPAFVDELGVRVSDGFGRPRRRGRARGADRSGPGPRRLIRVPGRRVPGTDVPRSGVSGSGVSGSGVSGSGVSGSGVAGRVAGWGAGRQWGLGLGAAATVAVVGVVLAAGFGSSSPVSPGSPAPTPAVTPALTPASQPPVAAGGSSSAGQPGNAPQSVAGSAGASSAASGPTAAGKAFALPPARPTGQSAGNAFAMPPAPATSQATGSSRAVESDASISLLAPRGQVQNVADGVIAATDRLGGVVETSQVSVADVGGSQATLALEVPSAALDRTLAAISALAHVSSRSQDTQDITDPTQAARERLSESRAERVALLRQLGRASTPNQVASIRGQLGLLDGRITQDEASLQALVGRASTASVDVTIAEIGHPAAGAAGGGANGSAWRPARALHDAFRVLEACFAVLVVALAGLIPAAAVVALGWWALRAVRRRRRQSALAGLG